MTAAIDLIVDCLFEALAWLCGATATLLIVGFVLQLYVERPWR